MITLRFNTGRGYTAKGQRITATLHDDGVVTFMDHDRGVTGQFIPLDVDSFDQATVMYYYDHNLAQQTSRSWHDGMMAEGCNAHWIECPKCGGKG